MDLEIKKKIPNVKKKSVSFTMSFLFLTLVFFLLFNFNEFAFGETGEYQIKDYVLCEEKKLKRVRTMRVHIFHSAKEDDKKCETIYTKQGKDEIVGSGKYKETCYNFLKNIKANLEKANWTCKTNLQARVSYF